ECLTVRAVELLLRLGRQPQSAAQVRCFVGEAQVGPAGADRGVDRRDPHELPAYRLQPILPGVRARRCALGLALDGPELGAQQRETLLDVGKVRGNLYSQARSVRHVTRSVV